MPVQDLRLLLFFQKSNGKKRIKKVSIRQIDRQLLRKGGFIMKTFFFNLLNACPRPTVVVVFPSPAGVGLIAVTKISQSSSTGK